MKALNRMMFIGIAITVPILLLNHPVSSLSTTQLKHKLYHGKQYYLHSTQLQATSNTDIDNQYEPLQSITTTNKQKSHSNSNQSTQKISLKNDINNIRKTQTPELTRRQIISTKLVPSFLSSLFLTTFMTTTLLPQKSSAACLYGDLSPSCIGVYKVPLDDEILPFVSTPDQLAKFAPDMKYVSPTPYPKSYVQAIQDIKTYETDVTVNLQRLVFNGELEQAGILVLSLIPKLTMAGRVVLDTLQQYSSSSSSSAYAPALFTPTDTLTIAVTQNDQNDEKDQKQDLSMRFIRVETTMSALLSSLGVLDVFLGQALRGDMGVVTAAQIQLLPDVKEVIENYKELKKALPDDF